MTTEVAVMNIQGIALAADSAVTINYPDGQKIYNSVNKLFTLSKYAPVGIMVYGVAELTNVPWETIIKVFREELGDKRFPHLSDYADHLFEYIKNHKGMFLEEYQERQLFNSVFLQYMAILRVIDHEVDQTIRRKGKVSDSQIRNIVVSAVRECHAMWTTADRLPDVPSDHSQRIRHKWRSRIEAVIELVFQDLSIGSTTRSRLIEIASLVFTADLFPDSVSGLVIAGFGEEDYLPSVVTFDIEGVLLDYVKMRKSGQSAISGKSSGVVIPFAQGEMVYLFMEGIDQGLEHYVHHALDDFVDEMADDLAASTGVVGRDEKILRDQIGKAKENLADQFFRRLATYRKENQVRPITSAVANLPKEELAVMAETLVSLTSFKRRVTHDPETVGGPIDVAIISKGDGFIWIKRKHYFDPALNHQFFANYFPVK
jgi:hypothetical protein